MRTFEEIKADIAIAMSKDDAATLRELAHELQMLGTNQYQATALNALGWAEHLTGDFNLALEYYNRATALCIERGYNSELATVTGNIGSAYFGIGEYSHALEYNLKALALHHDLGNRAAQARTTGNIGLVYLHTGAYPSALEYSRRALEMHEALGNLSGIASATGNVALVYFKSGDYVTAEEYLHQALTLHQEEGNRRGAARVTGNLGTVFMATGEYPSALEYLRRAQAMYEELGFKADVALAIGNVIEILLLQEAYSEATKLLEHQAAMPMDRPEVRATRASQLARLAEHSEDLNAAKELLSKALHISLDAGLRDKTATYHMLLRDLAKKRNDFEGYVHHNDEYLRITEEIRGKEATQKLAMMEAERKAEAIERERVKERALLYGALPESVATRMLRGEDVSGDHYENVSVLFLDIAGFTAISDRIPAGHVVHLLKAIFRVCDEACKAHGLTKIKTIGDSYLAVAFPETEGRGPKTHHAENAARAAIEMLQKLNALRLTMDPALGDTTWTQDVGEIRVRIGLHCGPIVAGVVGDERLQYDVWGDTVNVASRMESTGEPGRIHVSSAFADALKGLEGTGGDWKGAEAMDFGLRERGSVEVKGKGSMKTFWLEGQ